MKTSELIRLLQDADPAGDLECVVGNVDIYFVSKDPGYYDGCYQRLIRDPETRFYNVVGAEIHGDGWKIRIHPMSIEDAICEDAELPVTYVGVTDVQRSRSEERVAKWRKEAAEE